MARRRRRLWRLWRVCRLWLIIRIARGRRPWLWRRRRRRAVRLSAAAITATAACCCLPATTTPTRPSEACEGDYCADGDGERASRMRSSTPQTTTWLIDGGARWGGARGSVLRQIDQVAAAAARYRRSHSSRILCSSPGSIGGVACVDDASFV